MLGFNPLAASPIAATGVSTFYIEGTAQGSVNASATLNVVKNNSSAVSVTVTTSSNLVLENQLVSSINVTGSVAPATISTAKQLVSSIDVTGSVADATIDLSKNLAASTSTIVSASATLDLSKDFVASVSATVTTSPNLVLENQLVSSIDVSVTVADADVFVGNLCAGNLQVVVTGSGAPVMDNPLQTNVLFTAFTATILNADKHLTSEITLVSGFAAAGSIEVTKNLSDNLNVTGSVANATLDLDKNLSANALVAVYSNPDWTWENPLEAAANVTVNVSGLVTLEQDLSASIDVSGDIIALSVFVGNLCEGNLSVPVTVSATLDIDKPLSENLIISITKTDPLPLDVLKQLEGSLLVDTDISVGIPLTVACQVNVTTGALLDVDGNTVYSPGGESVEGFYPPSAVTFIRHSETAEPESYNIVANFSEDPEIITEIIEVDFDDNPSEVLSYSINNEVVSVSVLTPKQVYSESSTFLLSREVIPYYNSYTDYNTRWSTKIKQSRAGNNFYSTKFYIPGNHLCSLMDDGYGNINLYRWNDKINSEIINTVGTINYDTGYVRIRNINIISIDGSSMFFHAESVDSVIPTEDYLNNAYSSIVQSSTITFPSGETVEISQYEKSTSLVVVWAYVKARSYNINDPETTIETREVLYKIVIDPDYDVGKNKILQLLAEQTD